MKFSWNKIKKPIVALAPMANITTLPFRSICKEMGADIVFTPMLSSNAIIHSPTETLKIAQFLPSEEPLIIQIFGYDGSLIAKAANIANDSLHPAGIDINMGCPAPKIAKNECGSAMLKNYREAEKTIKIIRDQFDGQLSVKLRLGWNKFDALPFIKYLEKIGINAVSVHGRTAKQGYSGTADWEAIELIAKSVNIPVIGNGDIINWQSAISRLPLAQKNNKLSGIMIGRGALGNPWIFKDIKQVIKLKSYKVDNQYDNKELVKIIDRQTQRYIDYIGEKVAVMEMRKHLGWYIKGFPGALNIRKKAMQVETYKDIQNILGLIAKAY